MVNRRLFHRNHLYDVTHRLESIQPIRELPDAQVLENPENQLASEVYSSDGVLLGKYFNIYNRSNTEYKDLPESVANALIATEDVRFRSHSGIDFIGISTIVPYLMIGKKEGLPP